MHLVCNAKRTANVLRVIRIALDWWRRKYCPMRLLSESRCRKLALRKAFAKKNLIGEFLAVFLAIPLSAAAQINDPDTGQFVAPLFASHLPLQVTIEAPLTTLTKDRPEEEYLDGTFTFTGDEGAERTIDLKIRTRGSYRRMETHCDFPPIRLNFRKKQVADTVFAGQDKLKLVTHCQNEKPYYEQLLLREFLAYRIFQVMTNKSYGVRLLQVNYVDTEGAKAMTKLAFVIEEDDDVARRVGMKSVRIGDITNEDLDRRQQNLVNVFQYLIGNTDFSLIRAEPGKECCHNADLMSAAGGPPFTPLPYDFDFSGLVNAPYAQPHPRYDFRTVRHRHFMGLCRNNELLPDTLQQFLDKKDAIYAIIDELDMLRRRSRWDVTAYLNGFYKIISTPKYVGSSLLAGCS